MFWCNKIYNFYRKFYIVNQNDDAIIFKTFLNYFLFW